MLDIKVGLLLYSVKLKETINKRLIIKVCCHVTSLSIKNALTEIQFLIKKPLGEEKREHSIFTAIDLEKSTMHHYIHHYKHRHYQQRRTKIN